MNEVWIYSLGSVLLVSIISLIGIFTISVKEDKIKKYLHFFLSFSAGALIGDALLHLLPEIVEEYGFTIEVSAIIISAILFSFIMEKFVRWHHHHEMHDHSDGHVHPVGMMNLLADAFHNFLDGIVIGASYLISIPVGIATTIAVVLHEIPQEIGDYAILVHAGYSRKKALFFNFLTALTAILGAIVALALGNFISHIEFFVAPFAAGLFLYIAGSDLIPELHKNEDTFTSILDLVAFILGILIMALLLTIE